MKFMVIGLGSMGKRRIRNLQHLKAGEIIAVDKREDRRKEAEEKFKISTVSSVTEGMAKNPDAVIISTPPDYHMPMCKIAAEQKKHFFVEASVIQEKDFKDVISLVSKNDLVGMPSCTMRFYNLVRKLKEIVESKKYGKPLSFVYHMGQYLPDWHPWEDISSFYVGKKATGGAREMVCFEMEWINWIFGKVSRLSCIKGKYSTLKVDIDDIYSFNFEYSSGTVGNVMIDVVARFPYKQIKIMFENSVIIGDWINDKISIYDVNSKSWTDMEEKNVIHQEGYLAKENMYIEEMRYFIDAIKGVHKIEYTLKDDFDILSLLLAAEKSSDKSVQVRVGD